MNTRLFSLIGLASLTLLASGCDNAEKSTASEPAVQPAANSAPRAKAAPAAVLAPNKVVQRLYAAQKADKGPFFQTTNRALVDEYFAKELADMIWKDAISAKGEVGAIDFDPLYGSQDPQVKKFKIMDTGWGGDNKFGPADEAVVQVTFTDSGKERMVSYQFHQEPDKKWKIYDIHYRGYGEEVRLASLLKEAAAGYPSVK